MSVSAAVAGAFALFLVYALLIKWRLDRRPESRPPAAAVLFLVCALLARLRLDSRPAHRPSPRRRKAHP